MPEFATEILAEVLVPTVTGEAVLPKVKLPGISVTAGACVRPVPLKVTDSDAGAALSVMVNAALRAPVADGVKESIAEQD